MPSTVAFAPVLECRSVVVPLRGGRTREVKHPLPVRLEVPILDDAAVPVVATLRRVKFPEPLSHHGLVLEERYDRGPVDQTVVRVSPRGLPAVVVCGLDDVGRLEARLANEILYRRWTSLRLPCSIDLGIEARETVSSNAEPMVAHLRRREASIFVVGNDVYAEAPAPFLQSYGRDWHGMRLLNELRRSDVVLSTMVLAPLDPNALPEGAEELVREVRIRVPASWSLVRSIVRAVPSGFSEHNPDLLVLTADLARASGIAADDVLAYDRMECRRIVEAMAASAFKTMVGTGLASVVDSGILDDDVVVERPGASSSSEDETALGMGF